MIVFLIGFMGSGKSTTGRKLAGRLGYAFVDTDKVITGEVGMSVNEIFDRLGEEKFREQETRLLKELVKRDRVVVSTGGGLPCHSNNMDLILQYGRSVYLRVSPLQLHSRLYSRKHKRPLIRDLSEEELKSFIERTLGEREDYYNRAEIIVKGISTDLDELVNLLSD